MKQLLFTIALMLLPMLASADIEVEVEGVYYNLLTEEKTATVTKNPNGYEGDIVIKEAVEYDGRTWSVTTIGDQAFMDCPSLTSIYIPNSVTVIGWGAFENSGLTSVTIPSSVTTIRDWAFCLCRNLTSISIDEANQNFKSLEGVLMSKDGKTLMAYPTGKAGAAYTIPDGVTELGWGAFRGSRITAITIPNSVTAISNSAFQECSGLTSVTIPDGVISIDEAAFEECSNLTTVTIPNSVTSIGVGAFSWCSSLTSVTIPNGVTSIGEGAFSQCSSLNSIEIPDGVKTICSNTFYQCSGLTSVTIPGSVSEIEWSAFNNCTALSDFYCYARKVPMVGEDVFYQSNYDNATLHVPATSVEAYKAAEPWNQFKEIVAISGTELDKGDANGDGAVNIADIVEIVNFITGNASEDFIEACADANGDGLVNADDIVTIVGLMKENGSQTPSGEVTIKLNDNSKVLAYWSDDKSAIMASPLKEGDVFNNYSCNIANVFIGGTVKLDILGLDESDVKTDVVFAEKDGFEISSDGKTLMKDGEEVARIGADCVLSLVNTDATKKLLSASSFNEAENMWAIPVKVEAIVNDQRMEVENGSFNVRFANVIKADNIEYTLNDAPNDYQIIPLRDIVGLSDMYGPFKEEDWSYYNIKSIKITGADTKEIGDCIYTDISRQYQLVSSLPPFFRLIYEPIEKESGSYGESDSYGTLKFGNNSGVTSTFHLKIPLTIVYEWGEVQTEVIVTLSSSVGQ